MTTIAKTPKLIAIEDLRPIDFQSGKRLALPKGQGHICHRCRKEHSKIYWVETVDGSVSGVGSGCIKAAFAGWSSSDEEIKEAQKSLKEKEKFLIAQKTEEHFAKRLAELQAGKVLIYNGKRYAIRDTWRVKNHENKYRNLRYGIEALEEGQPETFPHTFKYGPKKGETEQWSNFERLFLEPFEQFEVE